MHRVNSRETTAYAFDAVAKQASAEAIATVSRVHRYRAHVKARPRYGIVAFSDVVAKRETPGLGQRFAVPYLGKETADAIATNIAEQSTFGKHLDSLRVHRFIFANRRFKSILFKSNDQIEVIKRCCFEYYRFLLHGFLLLSLRLLQTWP